MAASDDYLNTQIDAIANRITTDNIPNSPTDHRKLVDVVQAISRIKSNGGSLETNLPGAAVYAMCEGYFALLKNE